MVVRKHVLGHLLRSMRSRWQQFWDLEEPDERIEGSGEVYLDPAYNGRYTAERRLRQLSNAQQEARAADSPRREWDNR